MRFIMFPKETSNTTENGISMPCYVMTIIANNVVNGLRIFII